MARTSADSLLEVVPEPEAREESAATGDGPDRKRRARPFSRRRRWWLAAVLGLLLVAAAIALPVRSTFAVNELHRLQARWAWFEALDGQRATLDARLTDESQDDTDPRVIAARAALAAEEFPLVRKTRSAVLAGRHVPDSGLHHLRQAMALALSDQMGDLARAAAAKGSRDPVPERGYATMLAVYRVNLRLNAELAQWRQPAINRPVATPPLRTAGHTLAQLATPADHPMGARLILAGPPGTLTTVDLGPGGGHPSSRKYQSSSGQLTGSMVDRTGYLAVAGNTPGGASMVYAVRPDLTGEPRVIGSTVANVVVSAAAPDAVWLQVNGAALEVNGSGAVLDDVVVASNRVLVGATDQVLVTTGLVSSEPSSDLQVVALNGRHRGEASVVAVRGQLIAAASGHLAWLDLDARGAVVVRLADGAAQGVKTVPPLLLAGSEALPIDSGAFSPDATSLAVRYLTGGADTRLATVDVATAAVHLVDGSIGDHPAGPIAWAPDGQQVFFVEATGPRTRIATWQVGSPSPTVIRVPAQRLLSLAANDAMSRSMSVADLPDLEILPLDGESPAPVPEDAARPRSRRWPRVVVAAAVVTGLLALPVRANVAAGQFRRLAQLWSAAEALDPARARVMDQLQQASAADDQTHMARGTAALEESEAARLLTLRRQLGGWLVPDSGLARLRGQMRQTMGRRATDLRAAAAALRRKAAAPSSPYSTTAVAEAAGVDQQVEHLRRRFGQTAPAAPPRVALRGAEADLAALHRYLDQPARTVLVTVEGSRALRLLDLDRSRTSTLDLGSDTSASQVVTRSGYIAVQADTPAGGLVLAADPGGNSPPRVIARQATSIAPAVDSGRLWVGRDRDAIEVDAVGTVVAGPIPLPADVALAGATSGALYTEDGGGQLLVTTVADGATRLLAAQGQLIAAGSPGVAWSAAPDGSGRTAAILEFSTDDGKTSRSLPNPINTVAPLPATSGPALAVGPGAFSPDGRHLALWWLALVTSRRTTTVFSLVDLATGHNELVPGTADDLVPQAVGWAPDGRRVFLVRGQGTTELWSYRPGAGRPEAVRVHGVTIDAMAVAGE